MGLDIPEFCADLGWDVFESAPSTWEVRDGRGRACVIRRVAHSSGQALQLANLIAGGQWSRDLVAAIAETGADPVVGQHADGSPLLFAMVLIPDHDDFARLALAIREMLATSDLDPQL